jgi:hypothetical protein
VGVIALGVVLIALVGCAQATMAGTYQATVRVQEGKEESTEPGYSLQEVQAWIQDRPQSLVLGADGHFELRTEDRMQSGFWRVDRGMLILRADTSGGVAIQPALQQDREWRIGAGGELIDDSAYGSYNLEEVYTRE